MNRRSYSLLLALLLTLLAVGSVRADDPPKARRSPERFAPEELRRPDSLDTLQLQRNERLYDSLQAKTSRRKAFKALYEAVSRRPVRDTTQRGQIRNEAAALLPYAGKEVGEIHIERLRPFNTNGNWWERAANNLHTLTRSRIIHRDLLFGSGDRLDPELVARNKQLLQSRRNIAEVDVRVVPDPLDTNRVDVVIRTRDSWTISADAGIHSGNELMFGLSESNLWGRGHELRLQTSLDYRHFAYGGNLVEYYVPNMWGSFYEFKFEAGKEFDRSRFGVLFKKDFLKPTDYEVGVEYLRSKERYRFPDRDTVELINHRRFDLWGGYSRYIAPIESSLYLMGRYHYRKYLMRPEATNATTNPALHHRDLLLSGVGLYREHYYSATMIYGYGKREYLTSGYRSELNLGYQWGEYADELYLGFSHKMGGFLPVGYLMGRLELAGYLNQGERWNRAALDAELRWFSNLYGVRRTHIRQFLGLSYTQGWNRGTGADEWLEFTNSCGPRVLDERLLGTSRMTFESETVFFTPYEPLGFKMAIYGFLDLGLLGYYSNVFKNDPWCALGVGVRVRNERLVFPTIQFQLGVAFGRHGWADSKWVRVSSEPDLQQYRYTPQRPEVLLYK